MLWIKLFLPFAGAYFLSYLFRTANAVIGPILADELSLGPADLGLLTSAYFLSFGLAQMPLGVLLDRFGARRVEAALLFIAAAGAAIFACGDSIGALAFCRGMIGLGFSACFMAALKSFSQWFPLEKQASLIGWIMTAGTLGAFAASAPLNAALHIVSWRVVFFALAAITLTVVVWLFFSVPDKPGTPSPEPLAAQWTGVRQVLISRHFWRFAPLGLAQIGGFMAIQSLWSGAWLTHVNGYSRTEAADHLAAMNVAMISAYALIGMLATRLARHGIKSIHLLLGGIFMAHVTLLMIITQLLPQHYLLWIAYGAFSSFGTLAFPQTSAEFPVALSGRVNTALNLVVFFGAFVFQWGIGVIIDLGHSTPIAYRNAFAMLFAIQIAAYIWLLIGSRGSKCLPASQ